MTLPRGWANAEIGDIVAPIETRDPTTCPDQPFKYIDIGSIDNLLHKIVQPKVILGREAPSRARRCVKKGDVLFSTVRPYLKNIAQIPEDLDGHVTSTGICVLRSECGIEARYLLRRVISDEFISEMTLASDGTMYPAISDRDVLSAAIAVPPAAEQRRIVAKLDALTARIAHARAELGRVAMLAAILRQRALSACFANVDASSIELGQLLHGIEAGKNLRCEERPPLPDELGVVKVSAVSWGHFDATQAKTLPADYYPPEKARIRAGDLLFSRANTIELVGAVVLVEDAPENLFLSDKILRLVLKDEDKKWLLWFLRAPSGRKQIEDFATGNQFSMRNLSQNALRRICVPYPGADVRASRVARLEVAFARADRMDAEAAHARSLLDRLEAAILARAFRGELVPQDPDDEPASVLLERIRAERAAAPKPKRRRRARAES